MQAAGKIIDIQFVTTNIDYLWRLTGGNVNRITQRYFTIRCASHMVPIIVLNKINSIDNLELQGVVSKVRERIKEVPMITISNITLYGVEQLLEEYQKCY